MAEELRKQTEQYIAQVESLLAARKFGEGIFGMPDSAKNSPCHMEYYEAMHARVQQLVNADSQQAEKAVHFLLHAHTDYTCSDLASWMLLSIQQLAKDLIPLLTEESKKQLSAWYEKQYPRFQRMPAQKEICRLLKK